MTGILQINAFRAYSHDDRKVYDVDHLLQSASRDGWLVYGNLPGQRHRYLGIEGEDCNLMCSIGKKDRTGRDIYSGHIMKYILPPEHGPDAHPDIYVVEWGEYGFEARWANPPTPNYRSSGYLSLQDVDKDMEIIGTIFENSELLEKYKK